MLLTQQAESIEYILKVQNFLISVCYSFSMSDITLFSITFGFISGILVADSIGFGVTCAAFLMCGVVYFAFIRKKDFWYSKWLITLCIFCIALTLGYVRYTVSNVSSSSSFQSRIGSVVHIGGTVTDDPDVSGQTVATVLYVGRVGVRVSIKTDTHISYGDHIVVSGILARPENFETDQGTEFDYVSYLSKDNILYVIKKAQLVSYTKDTHISLHRALYSFRHSIESKLSRYLSDSASGFVQGILLGTKASIDPDLYNALIRTSTVHVIALSGYNVSIVAEGISQTFGSILPPLVASGAGAVGIILFVIMTGGSSTAIRAGFMALLVLFSRVSGRPAHSFRIVALASLALLIYNPAYLVSDVSFQLSFLALLGLMIVSPIYVSWLAYVSFVPKRFTLLVGETLGAETAVVPFIIYKMGIFSVVSLPVNLIILPFIPMLMFAGFVLICVGFTVSWLGPIAGYPVGLLAMAIIGVIEKAAAAPWAAAATGTIPWQYILISYVIFLVFFLHKCLTK